MTFRKLVHLSAALFLASFMSSHALAADKSDRIADLAHEPFWLKLIHYKDSLSFTGDVHSDVLTPAFFLAADGAKNPQAELVATIAAMHAAPGANPDLHAQCRFPARFAWLREQLAWTPGDAHVIACPAFKSWRGTEPVTGASLIFASGYLKNPASYYGHMLLKLNTGGETTRGSLFEQTLNYGAVYPENENGLLYIFRGMGGGYQSTFSHLEFFRHRYNYAEEQLRDVWEYELELDQRQTDYLTAHSWELMGTFNRYYFLKQNCAFRIAELVNLVVDQPLVPPNKSWVMPIDVFRRLIEDRPGQPSLIRQVSRVESRQNAFREQYLSLPREDRQRVSAFIENDAAGLLLINTEPNVDRRSRIIETLIDYYSFLDVKAAGKDIANRKVRNELLIARFGLPANIGPSADPPAPPLPHDGQKSSLVQVASVSNSRLGDGLELRFRGAYYDFLTFAPATLPNSELSLLDARLVYRDNALRLRGLELVRVTTLNLSPTGLAKDAGAAWRLRFGLEDRNLSCQGCLVAFVDAGYGKGLRMGPYVSGYAFMNGRITGLDNLDAYLEAGPTTGLIFGPVKSWRGQVEAGYLQQIDGPQDGRAFARTEIRFGASPDWDVRAAVEYQNVAGRNVTEGRAALSLYW